MDSEQNLGFMTVFVGGTLLMLCLQLQTPPSTLRTIALVILMAVVILLPAFSVFGSRDQLGAIGRGTGGALRFVWLLVEVFGCLAWLATLFYSASIGWHFGASLFR